MSRILVVGGAGYIGSHMVKALDLAGFVPIVLDDLSTGHADAVGEFELVHGSMADRTSLDHIFETHDICAVMHFASFSQVGESVTDPAKYYANNVDGTRVLLDAMIRHGILALVFSSTAAVYGNPGLSFITEELPKLPVNPYGRSKWMVEQMLADYGAAYGLRSVALRYFNAAGADRDGELSERHEPETHLIPLAVQSALGLRGALTVFGDDYDTADGTCVRDYVHVEDLCAAHLLALRTLNESHVLTRAYNLGNGAGFSVRQVLDTVQRVLGKRVAVEHGPRRDGDPPSLVADASLARRELGWSPQYLKLDDIVRTLPI